MTRDRFYQAWAPHLLSLLRIITAALFLEHGTQKVLGFPPMTMMGGGGMPALPPAVMAAMKASGPIELVGGVLLLLGLFVRPTAFILAGEMAVAYFMMHAPGGFFPIVNHGELAVLYCFVFLYLVIAGGGRLSVDALIWRHTGSAIASREPNAVG